MLTVKIVRVPGAVSELMLNDGATVSTALDIANMSVASNEKIAVNGQSAGASHVLNDGDVVSISKDAKSG
jgi:ribosome-interacting GTPase 1